VIVGEGAGHSIWKIIEGEKESWVAKQREANTLREYLAPGVVLEFQLIV
jgi:hypothetical protein